jgi:hypothetical protein
MDKTVYLILLVNVGILINVNGISCASVFFRTSLTNDVSPPIKGDAVPHVTEHLDQLHDKQLTGDQIAADQLNYDRIADDQLAWDQTAADQLNYDRIADDQLAEDQTAADQLNYDRIVGDQLAEDQIATDRIADDQLAGDQTAADRIVGDQLNGDQLAGDQMAADQPIADKTTYDKIVRNMSTSSVALTQNDQLPKPTLRGFPTLFADKQAALTPMPKIIYDDIASSFDYPYIMNQQFDTPIYHHDYSLDMPYPSQDMRWFDMPYATHGLARLWNQRY